MTLDLGAVQKTAGMMFVARALEAYGSAGEDRLLELLNTIRSFFERIPPERLREKLCFVEPIDAPHSAPLISRLGDTVELGDFENLATTLGSSEPLKSLVIERRPNGRLYAVLNMPVIDIGALASDAIIYRYQDSTDYFIIDRSEEVMPKLVPGTASNFATPTLSSLEEALRDYAQLTVTCRCDVLADAWAKGRDGPRLVFRNKPESRMRRSLTLFLLTRLRDVSARQEHNTDETKPVDIKVDWFGSKMRALIEVKWLGKAIANQDDTGGGATFTEYGPARAQDGAQQLADYLDRERQSEADLSLMGYLVVFDGRRKGVKKDLSPVSKKDALYYADDDIVYNPDFAVLRDDFAPPTRYFLQPRASLFAA